MVAGICTNFLGADSYALHEELLGVLVRRFDYVEFPAMTIAELPEDAFSRFAANVERQRASCPVMTNLFPAGMRLLDPEFPEEAVRAYLERLLPRCRRLRCERLVFGSGKARSLLPGQSQEEGYDRLSRLLSRTVIPLCREQGADVLIEPLNAGICNFILTLEEGAELAARCGGNVTLLADSLHLMALPDIEKSIRRHRALISHVHLSEAGRTPPAARVSPQLENFLRALRRSGYAGAVSFECRMADEDEMRTSRDHVEKVWETSYE